MPGFAYTKYKVSSATFKSAILILRQKLKNLIIENLKQFCLTYVQLLRLQSLERLFILEPIILTDINN